MWKFAIWLFWTLYYACRPSPRSFDDKMSRMLRTWWPWRKFRPSVWHNDDGAMWHIYLTDERTFSRLQTIKVDCQIGMESGNIVGFNVWDETLQAVKAKEGE